MPHGVRLSCDDLIRTYGIGRRLAVRIGALLARRLEVTAILLEISGAGSAMERLLLHPELLEKADRLDTAFARKLAGETGADSEGELAVVESAEARVLALEEELLAEQEWRTQDQHKLPAIIPAASGLPQRLLDQDEIKRLFTAEEVARVKLDALTGRDEDTRISALRKLRYAPLSASEKGGIYLRVLLDPVGKVRAEAVKSLETLGFDRDAADAIQAAFDGDGLTRKAALRRIADLLGTLDPGEVDIVVAVLIEMLRESSPLQPSDPILRVLDRAAPAIARRPGMLAEITRVCVQHVMVDSDRIGPAVSDLLLKLAVGDPAPLLDRLWEEISTISDPGPRALLLGLLMEVETDEARLAQLCDLVADELLRDDHDELARQKLGHHLASLGPPAANAVISRFARADGNERSRLAPFLDTLCVDHDLPAAECNLAARYLLEALKTGDRRLRMEVLRTRVFHRPDLDAELLEALVTELLPMLRAADQPDMAERAAILLEFLGPVSAPGLFYMIQSRPAAPEADVAVRVLGRVLSNLDGGSPADTRLVASVFRFASQRAARPSNRLGGYAAVLAQIAAMPQTDPQDAQAAFELLTARLGKAPYHADLVEAIAHTAARAAVTPEQRVRAVHLLGGLVERPADEEETQLREIETDQGKTYELAGSVEFDSETLPAAVRGLQSIALSAAVSPALRAQIIERFLRVWEGVAGWKIIWGPRSSEALAGALGALAADGRTEDTARVQILRALNLALERLSVVRALGRVLVVPSASRELNRLAVQTALNLLEKWIEPEITPDEVRLVMTAAATAAARPEVSGRSRPARRLRQRVATLLFDELRQGRDWCLEPLERLRKCPVMPRSLRKEIAERLGLERPHRMSQKPAR